MACKLVQYFTRHFLGLDQLPLPCIRTILCIQRIHEQEDSWWQWNPFGFPLPQRVRWVVGCVGRCRLGEFWLFESRIDFTTKVSLSLGLCPQRSRPLRTKDSLGKKSRAGNEIPLSLHCLRCRLGELWLFEWRIYFRTKVSLNTNISKNLQQKMK